MRGSYFSDSSLKDRERKQLQADYMQRIAPFQEISNKTLERMLDIQNQELSFQRANVAFEEEKMRLQEARDASKMYPVISKQLEDAMEGKRPDEQRLLVSDVLMSNPTFFETKSGNALLTAVNAKISALDKAESDSRAKTNQVWNMAAQLGMPDIAEQVSTGGLTVDSALSEISKRKRDADTLEEQQKTRAANYADALKFQMKYVDDDKRMYRNVKTEGNTTLNLGDSEAAGGSGSIIELPKGTKFAETYRNNLIDGVSRYTNIPVEELTKEYGAGDRDIELYNLFGKRIRDNETEIFRAVSQLERVNIAPTTIDLSKDDKLATGFGLDKAPPE